MSWDATNRLRWISAGNETTSYRYDADGKRIAKSGPGGTAHYFGNLLEVEDPDGAARLVKSYYAGDLLLARQESGTRLWYHLDHLGSVRAMSDLNGASAVEYEYAAFGDTIGTTGSADNLRGYGAHWRDDESHLVYMGARYQDPVLGRFTQPDTMVPEPGDPQSWNRYSYVRNNPVNRVDPTTRILRRSTKSSPDSFAHWLRIEIHCGAVGPIHVEGHRRVIVDDAPAATCPPKARRRAVPDVLIFTALAPAHPVQRGYERHVAIDREMDVARIHLDGPVPACQPYNDQVAVHSPPPQGRRQVEDHRVRRIRFDDGLGVVVGMGSCQLL